MKRSVLACVAVIGMASASSAGVLYWQVNDNPTSIKDVNGDTPSTAVSDNFTNWNTAKIAYYSSDTTSSSPNTTGTAQSFTPATASDVSLTQVAKTDATSDKFALTVSDSSYSSGVFYIELYNGNTLVGRSKEYLTYDSAKQTFTAHDSNDVFDGKLSFFDGIKTWNGGSAYVAVPEPTSGIMLLLGAALLGLRRRRA